MQNSYKKGNNDFLPIEDQKYSSFFQIHFLFAKYSTLELLGSICLPALINFSFLNYRKNKIGIFFHLHLLLMRRIFLFIQQ